MSAIAFLEDAPASRKIADLSLLPQSCRTASFPAVLGGRGSWQRGRSWLGTLTAGIVRALAWIRAELPVDFVLRIDADALVIGSFAETVRTRLIERPDIGVLGAVGMSSNPLVRALQDPQSESRLSEAARLWPRAEHPERWQDRTYLEIERFGRVSAAQLVAFDRIRPCLGAAMIHGYGVNHYCQGGACVISRAMVDRMVESGYLQHPEIWEGLPFPDDVVLAMYAYAVDLVVRDCSLPGDPFGVQYRGLPYPPDELVARGHSIIHSVRNDRKYSEYAIRQYFKCRAPVR